MRCPECEAIVTIHDITLDDVVLWLDYYYPKDIFKKHPIAFIRRMMKWIAGADAKVMIDEEQYEGKKVEK